MNYKDYDDCYTPLGGRYLINDDIKEYIGRIVGRIGQKYYEKKMYHMNEIYSLMNWEWIRLQNLYDYWFKEFISKRDWKGRKCDKRITYLHDEFRCK